MTRVPGALVVFHLPAIGEQEVDPLGEIHAAATTQTDQQVDLFSEGKSSPPVDIVGRRVRLKFVEDMDLQARSFEDMQSAGFVADLPNSGVGDEEHFSPPQCSGQFPKF